MIMSILNLTNQDYSMKKIIFILYVFSSFFFGYSQHKIEYPYEGLKFNFESLYFVRNDTVFSCAIFKDNRVDSIKYTAIKYLKNDYIFLDSADVFYFKIIKKNTEFAKCEPSLQFIQIKEIVFGEYECVPIGHYVIKYDDGSTRIFKNEKDKNPDELKGSIKNNLLLR